VVHNGMDQFVSVLFGKNCYDFTGHVLAVSGAVADYFSFFLWQGPCNVKLVV